MERFQSSILITIAYTVFIPRSGEFLLSYRSIIARTSLPRCVCINFMLYIRIMTRYKQNEVIADWVY